MLKKSQPTLSDLFMAFKKDVKIDINCHAIATVQSYNQSDNTVVCKMNYTKLEYRKKNPNDDMAIPIEYPLVVDCPVVQLYGGEGGVFIPPKQGDHCMLLFNDRDMDNWFGGNNNTIPATDRLHAFSDAVALIGIRSLQNPIPSLPMDKSSIYYGDSRVSVGSKITVQNAAESLGPLLSDLVTAIENITTLVSGSQVPPTNKADFAIIKTRLQGLLE